VRCTFCQRSTKGYQVKDIHSLEEHLAELRENYDVGFVQIVDENFGSDKKHAYEVAQAMHRQGMLWICGGVRCVSVREEDAEFYKVHGWCALKFGIESGSQTILDLMEKNFTVGNVHEAVKHCSATCTPIAVMTDARETTRPPPRPEGSGVLGRMPGCLEQMACRSSALPSRHSAL
jgi:radical SAM superfamily enzyme YgiQ (UPF0313 family)